jgi:hypothetical protein
MNKPQKNLLRPAVIFICYNLAREQKSLATPDINHNSGPKTIIPNLSITTGILALFVILLRIIVAKVQANILHTLQNDLNRNQEYTNICKL